MVKAIGGRRFVSRVSVQSSNGGIEMMGDFCSKR